MLRVEVDTTSQRRRWRTYTGCVAFAFAALIVTGTTMSSVGIGELRVSGTGDSSDMVGPARAIRSDEYLRTSVWRIGALADRDLSFGTPLAAEGEILTGLVTRGWLSRLVLFESFLADAGRVLPDSVAFALLWWAPSLLFWLFAPRLFVWFGMSFPIALFTAALIYLSPAAMWWSLGPINSGLATSITAALLLLHSARLMGGAVTEEGDVGIGERRLGLSRETVVALAASALASILLARIPFAYAPWAIPTSAGVLAPAVFVATTRFGWRPTVKTLLIAGTGAAIAIAVTVIEHRAGFEALRDTLYPGSRRSTARAMNIGFLFGAPHLGVLKTTTTLVGTNASEISTGLTILAMPSVLYGFGMIEHWSTRLTAAWWGHAAAFAAFFAWIAIDLPTTIGAQIPGMSLIPPARATQVVGFIAIAWFGVSLSLCRGVHSSVRIRLALGGALVAFAALALSGSTLRTQHLPDLSEFQVIFNSFCVAVGIGLAIAAHRTYLALAPLVLFMLTVAVGTNPLIVGLGDLRSSATARIVRQLDAEFPGYWVTNSPFIDALLMANAVPALSGQQWTGPNEPTWRQLDPAATFEPEWNRGAAFVAFEFDPAAPTPRISAPVPDVIKIIVSPCDGRLLALEARVVVSTTQLDVPCLVPKGRLRWSGNEHFVYVTERSR